MRRLCIPLLILCLLLTAPGCRREDAAADAPAEASLFAMHTYMTFSAYGDQAESALQEATALVQELEALWSVADPDSEIYQINHRDTDTLTISDETAEILAFALEMAAATQGALDPTIYPVLAAWGFTTENKQVPDQEEIDRLLQLVDYRNVHLTDHTLTLTPGVELDLGAVAKGYTADLLTQLLQDSGVTSAILNLGGNVQAIGTRPDGSDWRIGVQDPNGDGYFGVLSVQDSAVVTSGGYENYFTDDAGNVYWHILDPSTGYPADSGLASVTIVSPTGRLGDALSTALFVMGPEAAIAYWREAGGFDMLLVTAEGEILLTQGLEDCFSLAAGVEMPITVIQE